MKKILTMVAVAVLCCSTLAFAGEDKGVGKKNWLANFGADFAHTWGRGDGVTTFTMNGTVGYFWFDWLAPELKSQFKIAKDYDAEYFTLGSRFYYNKGKDYLPYARLGLGVGSEKFGNRDTGFAVNPGVGIDYFLSSKVSIGIQVNYTAFIADNLWHMFDFPIGFSIYF